MENFNFVEIVGTYGIKEYSQWKHERYNQPCPDICAGEVVNGIVKCWFSKEERIDNHKKLKIPSCIEKSIVIVLESPHKEEYAENDSLDIPTPAIGKTGTNLQNNTANLITEVSNHNKNIKNGSYRIILMNSIQYQCSLGYSTENNRDIVFKNLWDLPNIKEDFKRRLKSYKPKFIFNLCTKGKAKPKLNCLVQELVEEMYKKSKDVELYVGNHPSSWYFDARKKVRNVRSCHEIVFK